MAVAVLSVPGISCAGCAKRVKGALAQVAGVTRVRVSVNTHQVTLEYEPDHVGERQLEERLGALGYPVVRPQRGKLLPIHALAVQPRGSTRITDIPLVSRSEYAQIAARRTSASEG